MRQQSGHLAPARGAECSLRISSHVTYQLQMLDRKLATRNTLAELKQPQIKPMNATHECHYSFSLLPFVSPGGHAKPNSERIRQMNCPAMAIVVAFSMVVSGCRPSLESDLMTEGRTEEQLHQRILKTTGIAVPAETLVLEAYSRGFRDGSTWFLLSAGKESTTAILASATQKLGAHQDRLTSWDHVIPTDDTIKEPLKRYLDLVRDEGSQTYVYPLPQESKYFSSGTVLIVVPDRAWVFVYSRQD